MFAVVDKFFFSKVFLSKSFSKKDPKKVKKNGRDEYLHKSNKKKCNAHTLH